MLDIKMIRTDGEKVKERIRKREMNLDSIVDEILDIDKKRRELTGEVESVLFKGVHYEMMVTSGEMRWKIHFQICSLFWQHILQLLFPPVKMNS